MWRVEETRPKWRLPSASSRRGGRAFLGFQRGGSGPDRAAAKAKSGARGQRAVGGCRCGAAAEQRGQRRIRVPRPPPSWAAAEPQAPTCAILGRRIAAVPEGGREEGVAGPERRALRTFKAPLLSRAGAAILCARRGGGKGGRRGGRSGHRAAPSWTPPSHSSAPPSCDSSPGHPGTGRSAALEPLR